MKKIVAAWLRVLGAMLQPPLAGGWGAAGHKTINRAAAEKLPPAVPSFLAAAADRLAWLGPEPDRWRSDAALREDYLALWRTLLPLAREVPQTLVLRDFHVDNLMRLSGREGVAACGRDASKTGRVLRPDPRPRPSDPG